MSRGRAETFTPEQVYLAELLADTNLTYPQIAQHLGVTPGRGQWFIRAMYEAVGVGGREGFRAWMLECELAPAGAS